MTYRWVHLGNGRSVLRKTEQAARERSGFPCPMIRKDAIDPVVSMADGKTYDSMSALRRTYRADGNPRGEEFTEIGNEEITFTAPDADPVSRRDDIKRAMHDVLAGNLPPEIAAIE